MQRDLNQANRLADLARARREAKNHRFARAGQQRAGRRLGQNAMNRRELIHAEDQAHYAMVANRLGNDIAPAIQALQDDLDDDDLHSVLTEESLEYENPTIPIWYITGSRKTYVFDKVCYKNVGEDLIPYDSGTRQWAGEMITRPFVVAPAGTVLKVSTGDVGSCDGGGEKLFVASSPFDIIRDFVIDAKMFKWFKTIRTFLAQAGSTFMNVATVGFCDFWGDHPYRHLTKVKKDIMIYREMYSYLTENKISSGVSSDNALLLARMVFREFKFLPIEIILETLLFFVFQRAAMMSEMVATTTALSSYLVSDRRFKAYREPFNVNFTSGALISGLGDITEEGWYRINSEDEVKMWDVRKQVCITRLPYVKSSAEHGSGIERKKERGDKFEMVEARGYNEGCCFYDPYPLFDTNIDHRYQNKSYQTVGGCFATAMMIIDGKLTREIERCFLRLSMPRPDEYELRFNQIRAVSHALEYGRNNARQEPNFDEQLTARIRENDHLYTPDAPLPLGIATPLQQIIADVHRAYMGAEMPPEERALMEREPFQALKDYIEIVGGDKKVKRLKDLHDFRLDPAVAKKKFNCVKFKPDEGQKYKFVADPLRPGEFKEVLKFGRATISITGSEWIYANPPLMYAMKHLIEHEITITRERPPVGEIINPMFPAERSRIELDGRVYHSNVLLDFDLWYRACLSETNNEQLARIDQQMRNWISDGPNRMAAVSHGDDIHIVQSDIRNHVSAVEADIADNDGSYTDSLLRLEMQEVGIHADPIEAYAQLANPLLLENPNNVKERLLLRSTLGMIRCSGGIGTTYGNSKGSFLVVLAYALTGNTMSVQEAGFSVGFNLTYNEFSLERSCFLSTFSYMHDDGKRPAVMARMKCLASIARNFGRCPGDLPGRAKDLVSTRWKEYAKGVVKGYVNEPDSLFIRALRVKHDGWSIKSICDNYRSDKLSCIDHGIIKHYYDREDWERGTNEYLACVHLIRDAPAFGTVVACAFIDRIMKVRYGMAPVVK